MKVKSESEVAQLCPTLCDPWTAAHQAPLPMGFSRQEYWSGLLLLSLKSTSRLDYCSAAKRNEMIHAALRMSLKNLILSEKSQSQKLTLPNSIYMKRPELADPWRTDSRLVLARGSAQE